MYMCVCVWYKNYKEKKKNQFIPYTDAAVLDIEEEHCLKKIPVISRE